MKTKFNYLIASLILNFGSLTLFCTEPAVSLETSSTYIAGRIVDSETGTPMEYVNVAVYKSTDSSLVTGTISNVEGKFKIDKIATGD